MNGNNLEQGSIILVDGSPTRGTEQQGKRPYLVISSTEYNKRNHITLLVPITSTAKGYVQEYDLENTKTKGFVLVNHIRSFDLRARPYTFLEKAPIEVVKKVLEIVTALCEIPE